MVPDNRAGVVAVDTPVVADSSTDRLVWAGVVGAGIAAVDNSIDRLVSADMCCSIHLDSYTSFSAFSSTCGMLHPIDLTASR